MSRTQNDIADTLPGTDAAYASTPASTFALTGPEAAALLGISQTHFFDLKREGKFGPAPIRLGRSVRYSRAEVLAWFNAGSPDCETWAKRHRAV